MKLKPLFIIMSLAVCCHVAGQEKKFEGRIVNKSFTSISAKSPLMKSAKELNGADTQTTYIKGDSINSVSSASGIHTCFLGDTYIVYSDNLKKGFSVPMAFVGETPLIGRTKTTEFSVTGEKEFNGYNCTASKKIDNSSIKSEYVNMSNITETETWMATVPYNIPLNFYNVGIYDLLQEELQDQQHKLVIRCTVKKYTVTGGSYSADFIGTLITKSVTKDLGMFTSSELKEITETAVTDEQLLPPSDYEITHYDTLPMSETERKMYADLYEHPAAEDFYVNYESLDQMLNVIGLNKMKQKLYDENKKYLKKQKKLVEATKEVISYDINDDWDY